MPEIEIFPNPFYSLFINHHLDSEHILVNIRKYNGCIQITYFGVKGIVRQHLRLRQN